MGQQQPGRVHGHEQCAELKTFVSNSLLFNQEANELYGQLYDAAEVNTDTLPEDVQQYFTNTVLYQPYLYAQMRGVSLETMLSQAGYSSVMNTWKTAKAPSRA